MTDFDFMYVYKVFFFWKKSKKDRIQKDSCFDIDMMRKMAMENRGNNFEMYVIIIIIIPVLINQICSRIFVSFYRAKTIYFTAFIKTYFVACNSVL